jgi:catechol 2,3-dioxygenase-like lactoylglutathione lyase family enzyme
MSTSTATGARISQVANVIIPVSDQDRMVEFYTETLGLEKRADVPFGEGVEGRWVEVAPSGTQTPIALCPPGPDNEAGSRDTGIGLRTDDIDGLHAQLRDRGVDVDPEVSRMGEPVPPLFWFRDPEGNTLMVVEIQD